MSLTTWGTARWADQKGLDLDFVVFSELFVVFHERRRLRTQGTSRC